MGVADLAWGNPRFTTVVNNGDPARRLDIAILGDGYAQDDQATFEADTLSVIDEFRTVEPLKTYFRHLNFHRVDIISSEAGTTDRWANPPIVKHTALDTTYSFIADRRLVGPDGWVMTVASLSGAPWDAIIVLVNYSVYGAATSPMMLVAYTSNSTTLRSGEPNATGWTFPRAALHEAGHSIAKLVDEYFGELPDIDFPLDWVPPAVLPWANVSSSGTSPKWSQWLTPGVSLPTPESVSGDPVGAFEGSLNLTRGLYRPKRRCLMRTLEALFCDICSEQWIDVIYTKSPIADAFTPPSGLQLPVFVSPVQQTVFHADLVRGDGVDIQTSWYSKRAEDVTWQLRQQTPDYADFSGTFPDSVVAGVKTPALWFVRCVLNDRSPRLRTQHVLDRCSQEALWNLVSVEGADIRSCDDWKAGKDASRKALYGNRSRECVEERDLGYSECTQERDDGYNNCDEERDDGYSKCDQERDDGYNTCAEERDDGYNECCTWWPCSWGCKALTWVSSIVCIAWNWVKNMVCVVWNWVKHIVCVVWTWIKNVVCVLWTWMKNVVCVVWTEVANAGLAIGAAVGWGACEVMHLAGRIGRH